MCDELGGGGLHSRQFVWNDPVRQRVIRRNATVKDGYPRLRAIIVDASGRVVTQTRFANERLVNLKGVVQSLEGDNFLYGSFYDGDRNAAILWEFSSTGQLARIVKIPERLDLSRLFLQPEGKILMAANLDCATNRPCAALYELDVASTKVNKVWQLQPDENYDRQRLRGQQLFRIEPYF